MGNERWLRSGKRQEGMISLIRRLSNVASHFSTPPKAMFPSQTKKLLAKRWAPLRDQVVIATKFGCKPDPNGGPALNTRWTAQNSRPEHVKEVAEASLKRLKTDVIDLFYQHRVDPNVPIEDRRRSRERPHPARQGEALRTLGKPACRDHPSRTRVQPVAALQSEYSLWSREPEAEVIPTLRN